MTIVYSTRGELGVGQGVVFDGEVFTVVRIVGLDRAGRVGIEWSNGVVDYALPDRRVILDVEPVTYGMYEVNDHNLRIGHGSKSYRLDELMRYAGSCEARGERVIIVDDNGTCFYLSAPRNPGTVDAPPVERSHVMQLTTSTETVTAAWAHMAADWRTLSIHGYYAETTRDDDGTWAARIARLGRNLIAYAHLPSEERARDVAESFIEDHHYGVPNWRNNTH